MIKLYDIVRVTHEDYQHFGEVLSMRTPSETFMVRMIPGHSGTLVEIPVMQLFETDLRVRWVHYAQVQGSGSFPVDMLRRELAAPLEYVIGTKPTGPIVIGSASSLHKPAWNYMRWESFGWKCQHLRSLRFESGGVS